MKKMMVVLLVLSLLVGSSTVLAQSAETAVVELNWADVETVVKEEGWEGEFYVLDEVALKFFVPEVFLEVELDDEMREEGYIAYFATEDESAQFGVQYIETDFKELSEYVAALKDLGVKDAEEGLINGLPVVTYTNPDNEDVACVSLITEKGYVLEFAISPITDETFAPVTMVITASIQEEE